MLTYMVALICLIVGPKVDQIRSLGGDKGTGLSQIMVPIVLAIGVSNKADS